MVNRSVRSSKNFLLSTIIRLLIFLLIAIVLICIGLIVGYSILGDGTDPTSIFQQQTWQRIVEFVGI